MYRLDMDTGLHTEYQEGSSALLRTDLLPSTYHCQGKLNQPRRAGSSPMRQMMDKDCRYLQGRAQGYRHLLGSSAQ